MRLPYFCGYQVLPLKLLLRFFIFLYFYTIKLPILIEKLAVEWKATKRLGDPIKLEQMEETLIDTQT